MSSGELGYSGSANLLVRYLKQGRADPRVVPSPAPRRLVAWIMTRPSDLPERAADRADAGSQRPPPH
ncbi:hypothetical protein BJF90_01335 [Pseudonocardia sp. CNS-004]|nr:hypothetical protein BJF90_01335 [Pseudonocardia sp. CNS-004]